MIHIVRSSYFLNIANSKRGCQVLKVISGPILVYQLVVFGSESIVIWVSLRWGEKTVLEGVNTGSLAK